jgi:hypothetical protein
MSKLPEDIFVKIEQDRDTTYPVADTEITNLVIMGETVKVGLYKLVEIFNCTGEVKRVTMRPPKRKKP